MQEAGQSWSNSWHRPEDLERVQFRIGRYDLTSHNEDVPIAAIVADGFFHGIMLALHFQTETDHRALGSAVLVAAGIAITASHIFSDSEYSEIVALGFDQGRKHLWEVVGVVPVPGTDITVLALHYASPLPSDGIMRCVEVTGEVPNIGDRVAALGYRFEQGYIDEKGRRRTAGNILCASGKVRNVYPLQRDSFMLTFPVVEVDFAVPAGISGGPVFDSYGRVFAIVSSSSSEGPSYVSSLNAALDFKPFLTGIDGFFMSDGSLRDITRKKN